MRGSVAKAAEPGKDAGRLQELAYLIGGGSAAGLEERQEGLDALKGRVPVVLRSAQASFADSFAVNGKGKGKPRAKKWQKKGDGRYAPEDPTDVPSEARPAEAVAVPYETSSGGLNFAQVNAEQWKLGNPGYNAEAAAAAETMPRPDEGRQGGPGPADFDHLKNSEGELRIINDTLTWCEWAKEPAKPEPVTAAKAADDPRTCLGH
jgi:hypothetical protein